MKLVRFAKTCLVLGITLLMLSVAWGGAMASDEGNVIAWKPQPKPLLSFKESSSGLDQPGMEGGHTVIAPADIDGDGDIDLLSIGDHGSPNINTGEHGIMIWYNDGTGKWSLTQNGDWGYGGISVGDVNNDGKWDVSYAMHHNYSKDPLGNDLEEVALGDGSGKSWTSWSKGLVTGGEDYGMFGTALGDFDNDGWLDFASNSFGCCSGVHTYKNNHDGTWTRTGIQKGGNSNMDIEFTDINADGNLDLTSSNDVGAVFLGNGKGQFTRKDSGIPSSYNGASPGDVNNDGYMDVATINYYGGASVPEMFLWDNGTQSWKNTSSDLPNDGSPKNMTNFYYVDLADMDNDGNVDLLGAGGYGIVIWKGDGTGKWTFAARISDADGDAGKWQPETFTVIGDVDHNGYNDIAIVHATDKQSNRPRVFLNDAPSQPSATLISPKGGERFSPGSVRFIDWLASGTSTIKLELSTAGNNGPWTTIKDAFPNGGRYQWTVPNSPSKNCYVKVTVGSASGMNAKPFEILGSSGPTPVTIQVGAPNGGENWTVGDQHDVTYTISGGKSPFDVTLEYSVAGPSGPWKAITTQNGVAGSGKYAWTIPNDPSTTAFVKASVKDSAAQTGSDASNAAFTIYAPPPPPQTTLSYVTINPSTPQSLNIGDTKQFSAKAFDTKGKEIATSTFAWSVTGTIGDVSPSAGASTTFTASTSGSGTVKVIATYNSKTATNSTEITVIKPGVPPLDKLTISPSSVSGDIGKSFTLTAIAKDVNGTDITDSVTFTWSIAAPNLADLNPSGKSASVDLKSAGETTVTVKASYNGVTKTATASVKVTKPQTEFPWWILMVLIAVVSLIVVLMFVLGRRRKKQSPYDWNQPYMW